MSEQKQEVLAPQARFRRDESIPRFTDVSIPLLGGRMRLRWLQPAQMKTMRQELITAGCRNHEYDVARHGKHLAVKLLHISG